MVERIRAPGKRERFAAPPWTKASAEWRALDRHVPADHLARRIQRPVALLDWTPLFASYLGVAKQALPPDLLLQAVCQPQRSRSGVSPRQDARVPSVVCPAVAARSRLTADLQLRRVHPEQR